MKSDPAWDLPRGRKLSMSEQRPATKIAVVSRPRPKWLEQNGLPQGPAFARQRPHSGSQIKDLAPSPKLLVGWWRDRVGCLPHLRREPSFGLKTSGAARRTQTLTLRVPRFPAEPIQSPISDALRASATWPRRARRF